MNFETFCATFGSKLLDQIVNVFSKKHKKFTEGDRIIELCHKYYNLGLKNSKKRKLRK